MVLAVTGCKQEDLKDDVNALKDRVTLLEEQVKLLNENIAFFSKVLVCQTIDNGDGTFTEVPAYSISEVLVNDGTTFTAKFNDGNVLTLAIGSKGTVTTPQLGVNPETGKWMLNGSDTPYNAVGADSSVDGDKPEFNIALDNSTRQYYWQVRFGDSEPWQNVTDAEGNKVYVTEAGGELAKDNLFKDAEVEENEFVLTYYINGDGQDPTAEVRIPIISDLSCVINVPEKDMADGYWEIGADGASAEVEIKGDHWFVIAPHGWEASISETLTDGKATLTVKKSATASAGLKSRATANNTDEVVVQVNKGMYWAVAKVKVREKVTDYFNQVYSNGQDIVVGEPDNENGYGLKINNTDFSGGQLLQDAASISDNGVYFIEEGVTVTLDAISDLQSLVIVGNNPEKPSTVKVEANSFLLGATGGKGIVMKNVILDAENGNAWANFALLQSNTSLGEFNKVIVQNNTLVNLLAKNILARAKMNKLSVTNNLLWNNSSATDNRSVIALMSGSDVNAVEYGNNKVYDISADAKKWTLFYGSVTPDPIEGGNNLPIEAVDPFTTEGGSMDWNAGVFVPGAGYENIGAHIN